MAKGLEFAPGTTDETKKLIGSLFEPSQLFSAYRAARARFGTGDLVLMVSEQDPSGFEANTRGGFVQRIKAAQGPNKPIHPFMKSLVERSAQSIVTLPFDSDAMWLVVVRGMQAVPVTCVLYAMDYATDTEEPLETAVG